MFRFAFLVLLPLAANGQASVTAAWKVPIERVAPDHEKNEAIRKLDEPPGESAFFQPGDKLWDVSKAVQWLINKPQPLDDPFEEPAAVPVEVKWQGEWLVWNARSRMMVARGSWNDLLLLQEVLEFEEMPLVIRTRVDLVGGDAPAAEKRSIGLVSRSGEKATMEFNGLKVGADSNAPGKSSGLIDASLQISWPADAGESRWQIATAVTLENGKRLRLARQGPWELFITVSSELMDGTAVIEARWLETPEGLRPWNLYGTHPGFLRKQLGEGRILGIYPCDETLWARTVSDMDARPLPEIETPPELAPWIRGRLVDVRKVAAQAGIEVEGAGNLAAVDPLNHRVFIVTDPVSQDLAQHVFAECQHCSTPPIWIATNPESGGWGLACRSGERARISRSGNEGKELIFEIEPTQGADGVIFDLRYTVDVVSGEKSLGRLQSATLLMRDTPQNIGTGFTAAEEEVKVIVTTSHVSQ